MKNGLYKRGKTWWYRFRFAGRVIHESAKTHSRTVAREALKERRRQLEMAYNGIEKRELPPTFEKAAEEWQEGREGRLAPNTLTIGRVSIDHLLPVFGSKLLSEITPSDVAAYQQKRMKDGVQGRTVNIEVQTLRQILKANKFKQLDSDVRPLKERKDIGRALTPDEETKLLGECAKADSACYTAVVLALNTGMRKDEIRKLKWEQVDLFERILIVGKSKTDAGSGRVIPMNNAAVKALADWGRRFPNHRPEHYIFPRYEGTLSLKTADPTQPTKGWRTAWRCALKRAGLKLRFHDLRHTAITKLAEGQASDQTIRSIAGHVSQRMLEHYSHVRIAAKRAALDAISTSIREATQTSNFEGAGNQNGNQNESHRKGIGPN